MKNPLVLFVTCAFVAGGMWLSLHATTVIDAACWGYMAGMYGACTIRIGAKS